VRSKEENTEYSYIMALLYTGTPATWKMLTVARSLTRLHTLLFERVLECCQVRLSANVARKISFFSSPACTHYSTPECDATEFVFGVSRTLYKAFIYPKVK
jgi:hypothetical protein